MHKIEKEKLLITLYTSTYNDEIMIPHTIKWYRERFPDCRIIIGDNRSTDRTEEICRDLGCEFRPFDSGNCIPVEVGQWVKNNSWREKTTDWIMLVDCDEFVDINQIDLKREAEAGTTIIKTQGWDVYNIKDDYDVEGMNRGCRNILYDKLVCFNKKHILKMNFEVGAHAANPEGNVIFSKKIYNLMHKKYLNVDYVFKKYQESLGRIPQLHLDRGYSFEVDKIGKVPATHFYNQELEKIKMEFEKRRKMSIPLKIRSDS